jgi:ElaB/YqjD/DUF883 family membrane-anchored ribosome-binding protein
MATSFFAMPRTHRARERVALDLHSLARDAERFLDATKDDLGEKAHRARRELSDVIERVRDTTADWRDRGVAVAQTAARHADETVRANPYRSVGAALGLGVVIGLLLGRRR